MSEFEGRYKLLFEGSPDAILLIAPDNIIIDCNAGAENLLEQSRQFIIGSNFESFYQKNIISNYSFSELYTMMVEGKAPQPLEIEIKTKNGTHEWYKVFSNIITIQGPYPHIQLYIRKITERKKKEAQLRNDTLDSLFLANISSELSGIQHENDVFRFISDHLKIILPDTVVLINRSDPDGNNLVTEELLGVSLDEAVYLTKLVGEELTDTSFNTSDLFKDKFSRPVLQYMGNSFYEFCNHKISQKTSRIIDGIFKTNAIHTIGIADHGQYFGFIHIFSSAKKCTC
ncbi:MAG: PAS domain S-box protein [Bacteroidetes bacterium]|nr:PAS domain S-box protein [Bacteroidota bacterium]